VKKTLALLAQLLYKTKFYILRDKLISEYTNLSGDLEDYSILSNMLIIGEDRRFNKHIGFDIIAIFRAIKNTILSNKLEGGSTIEQQLVRVLTNHYDRTISRKVSEIFLATTVTYIIPKEQIAQMYLNIAYYGTEMNGLNQAKDKLGIEGPITIDKAADLVTRIKYPESKQLSPKRKFQIEQRKKYLIHLYLKTYSSK
jgi:membrane carboxypeptidase/penicillin-binding protein